jgi:hypothetical protein
MKAKRYRNEQIIYALKRVETRGKGMGYLDVCV